MASGRYLAAAALAAVLIMGGCDEDTTANPAGDSAVTPTDGSVDAPAPDLAEPDLTPLDLLQPDLTPPDMPLPTCTDTSKNGDETDVDCGGGTCPGCADGKKCLKGTDCLSAVCTSGVCAAPSCSDKVKNSDETDVDCGGAKCPKCFDAKQCKAAGDCVSGVCDATSGLCLAPTCGDKVKNSDETDVDCGGSTCPKCADKKGCKAAADCLSGVCDATSGLCAAPSCTDNTLNGDETDTDCGGSTCPACAASKKCKNSADCQSGVCDATSGLCLAPTCGDKVKNGDETDADCGGSTCPKCADKKGCKSAADCLSGVCDATSGQCAAPKCTDKVKNGSESDMDCGGTCPACADGKTCTKATDCSSGVCDATSGLCLAPTCGDKVKNGVETDVDCGGATCPACASGKACSYSTDCDKGICEQNKCRLPVSCDELHKAQPKLPTGSYSLAPDSAGSIAVTCEMTAHSGGWTLIGSVVNGVARKWNTVAAFTDTTVYGAAASAKTANYKSAAWSRVSGDDLRMETSQYSFGFNKLLGAKAFGPYIKAGWPAGCNTTWLRSGADFATGLTATLQKAMNFTLRAKDTNASCFPGTNENTAVSFIGATCCWVGGLGNNPSAHGWGTHDLSLLTLSRYKTAACTKNVYPCNANGLLVDQTAFCYDATCKVKYALIYVR